MGGGVPIVDDVLDFGGDIIDTAGDFIGDAVETVGNVVEDIDPITLAKIAYTISSGDPSLFLEDMGEEAFADYVMSEVGDYATDPSNWMDYLDTGGDVLSDIGGDALTDIGTEAFDPSSFLPGENPYDPMKQFSDYTKYAKDAYNLYNQLNPEQKNQVGNQFQQQNLYNPSSGEFDYGNALSPFINQAKNYYDRASLISNLGDVSSHVLNQVPNPTPGSPTPEKSILGLLKDLPYTAMQDLLTVPGLIGTGLGIASIADQRRVNNLIQQGYDENKAKKLVKEQQYTTPAGIASLPRQDITGLTPRTTANVVVRPGRADGGSMSNMLGEYMNLNSAMRNYKMRSRGGVV